jgi:hypothetical protein
MLDIIYWTPNYNELSNNESVDDEYSGIQRFCLVNII